MDEIKNWLELPEEQRKRYISTIGIENGISAETVEKDWWVTLALRALFNSSFAENISLVNCLKLKSAINSGGHLALLSEKQ